MEVREPSRKSLVGEWVSTVGWDIRTADRAGKDMQELFLRVSEEFCMVCFALRWAGKMWQILFYPGCLWHLALHLKALSEFRTKFFVKSGLFLHPTRPVALYSYRLK